MSIHFISHKQKTFVTFSRTILFLVQKDNKTLLENLKHESKESIISFETIISVRNNKKAHKRVASELSELNLFFSFFSFHP